MEDKTARTVPVELQRLDPDLPPPAYAHPGDAGADLVAAEDVDLRPGERALVRTGIAIALPPGYVGLVHPRSGLAARLGVTVLNAPGTVDAGYRGEILVNLVNLDPGSTAKIRRGDRIAQLVVQQVERAHFHVVDQLPPSRRGVEGHGSTGGHAGLVGDRSGSAVDEPAPSSAEPDRLGDWSGSRRGGRRVEPDRSGTNGEVE